MKSKIHEYKITIYYQITFDFCYEYTKLKITSGRNLKHTPVV